MPLYSPAIVDTGTTILDGAIVPASGIGADGNYYLNTSNDTLYGPKVSGGAPSAPEYVSTGATPVSTQGNTLRYGNDYQFLVAGIIIGARFWRLAASSYTTRQLYLFNSSQILIATSNSSVEGVAFVGWIEVTFPASILVTAGQIVTICYDDASVNAYTTGSPATADPAATDHVLGRWGTVGSGFPTVGSGAYDFSADLLWQRPGDVWPVALVGV